MNGQVGLMSSSPSLMPWPSVRPAPGSTWALSPHQMAVFSAQDTTELPRGRRIVPIRKRNHVNVRYMLKPTSLHMQRVMESLLLEQTFTPLIPLATPAHVYSSTLVSRQWFSIVSIEIKPD